MRLQDAPFLKKPMPMLRQVKVLDNHSRNSAAGSLSQNDFLLDFPLGGLYSDDQLARCVSRISIMVRKLCLRPSLCRQI